MSIAPPSQPHVSAATKPSFLFYYFIYLLLVMIPTIFFLVGTLLVVPHFKEIFKDFRTTLPLYTQWALSLSAFLQEWFLWIPVLLTGLALPLLPAWLTTRQSFRPNRIMYVLIGVILMLLSTLLIFLVTSVAIYLPLIKLIQSVSGGENDRGG